VSSGVLSKVRARLAGWLALRVLLTLLAVAGGAALAGLLGDAAFDFSDSTRAGSPWLLGLFVLAVLAVGWWQWRKLDEARMARRFECLEPALGSRLTNAVQLATRPGRSEIEEFLRREAVELGRRSAAELATWPVARRGLQVSAALAGALALGWLAFLLLAGDVWRAVWPRFVDPHGDHPPFSRLHIAVQPGDAEVLYGSQLEVRATAGGRQADKLWLVARSGTNLIRALMFLAQDKTYFQTMANLREPTEYFVTDGAARSRRFPIRIRYTPQITLVEVATEFPSYTGKVARTNKLADEPQAFPADTRVTFRVASNRPLGEGRLALTPVLGGRPTEITLRPAAQPTIVTGAFTLAEPVGFTVSVRDVDGLAGHESRQGRFNVLPDERPRLFVLEPGRDAVATPSIRVPVRVQAQDDYGVTRVVWLRGHNRSLERPFAMQVTLKDSARSVESVGAFDLGRLGVRPGDVIDYYFEAADNYPKGPNVTLSRPFRLQIISNEQYAEVLRRAAARQALFEPYFKTGAWLRRLAERARKLEEKAKTAAEADRAALAKEAAALADELDRYRGELGKLLEAPTLFDVEKAFRNSLAAQQDGVARANKKLKQLAGSGQMDPKALSEVSEALTKLAEAEEQDVTLPADQIARVARLLARADAFVKLAQRQGVIAQMLRRFLDQTEPLTRLEQMEVQELTHQQRRVQEELHELLASLPDLLAQLPAESTFDPLRNDVNQFLKAVEEAKIEPLLADAIQVLAQVDAVTGYGLAQNAADKMDALISKCSSQKPGLAKQCLHFQPSLHQALGNTLDQILAAMGVNSGSGQGGRDGYSLFNENVALYGPNMDLAGTQAGGPDARGGNGARGAARLTGDARDAGLPAPNTAARLRLQPNVKFPLRYRELVGEYFRAIAEEGAGEGATR
jgi:hypothetical protein